MTADTARQAAEHYQQDAHRMAADTYTQRVEAAATRIPDFVDVVGKADIQIAKAKKNDAPTGKVVKLKLKLRDKRAKVQPLKKAEKFACSIPR